MQSLGEGSDLEDMRVPQILHTWQPMTANLIQVHTVDLSKYTYVSLP